MQSAHQAIPVNLTTEIALVKDAVKQLQTINQTTSTLGTSALTASLINQVEKSIERVKTAPEEKANTAVFFQLAASFQCQLLKQLHDEIENNYSQLGKAKIHMLSAQMNHYLEYKAAYDAYTQKAKRNKTLEKSANAVIKKLDTIYQNTLNKNKPLETEEKLSEIKAEKKPIAPMDERKFRRRFYEGEIERYYDFNLGYKSPAEILDGLKEFCVAELDVHNSLLIENFKIYLQKLINEERPVNLELPDEAFISDEELSLRRWKREARPPLLSTSGILSSLFSLASPIIARPLALVRSLSSSAEEKQKVEALPPPDAASLLVLDEEKMSRSAAIPIVSSASVEKETPAPTPSKKKRKKPNGEINTNSSQSPEYRRLINLLTDSLQEKTSDDKRLAEIRGILTRNQSFLDVTMTVRLGADVAADAHRNINLGLDPIMYTAKYCKRSKIINLLITCDTADLTSTVTMKNNPDYGKTALDIAKENDNDKFLEAYNASPVRDIQSESTTKEPPTKRAKVIVTRHRLYQQNTQGGMYRRLAQPQPQASTESTLGKRK